MPSTKPLSYEIDSLPGLSWTVNVRVARRLRFRLWLSRHLIWLAAWLLDCDVEVNVNDG